MAILISIMILYVLLARLGIYTTLGILLFPILSMPLAVSLIQDKFTAGTDFLFNSAVIIGIYLMTSSIQSVLVYTVMIAIPAYTVVLLHRRKLSVPHVVMYSAIIIISAIWLYLGFMKYLGTDYQKQFILIVNEIKQIYFENLEALESSLPKQSSGQISMMKEAVIMAMDTIKLTYPAILLMTSIVLTTIQILFLGLVLKMKKANPFDFSDFFHFRLSKMAVLVLFFAMMATLTYSDINNVYVILSFNIIVFFENLFQIIGVIAVILLLKKLAINKALKIVSYILIAILFVIYPSMLMMFGCLDTIFDYRKAEIIV